VAGFAVSVEAVAAMTQVLADNVLTRRSRRTLVPTGGAFIHVCQHQTTAARLV